MGDIQDSPTKQIREGLEHLQLRNDQYEEVNTNKQKSVVKNHLQIPKVILNHSFKSENAEKHGQSEQSSDSSSSSSSVSHPSTDLEEEVLDTVIHNSDVSNATLPDFMKVKLELEANKPKLVQSEALNAPIISKIKPKLIQSVIDDADITDLGHNTTWEQLKQEYKITDEDLYDGNFTKSFNATASPFNQTTYSFQDLQHQVRVHSNSSTRTGKATSFKSNFVDSPLAPPKLIRHIPDSSGTSQSSINLSPTSAKKTHEPLFKKDDQLTISTAATLIPSKNHHIDKLNQEQIQPNKPIQLKVISPADLSMVYDEKQAKWIFPPDIINETTTTNSNNTNVEVTSVTNIELSFSQSKRVLICALTDTLKPNTNWDLVSKVSLPNKGLITMVGISEFLPNLKEIELKENNLTNFEGLPVNLVSIDLSHNAICDHLTNFNNFSKLLTLDLSHNKVSNMEIFQNLPSLRQLNLSHNKIRKLVGLPNVMELNLSSNRIDSDLDFDDYEFNWLWSLDLSSNDISSVKNLYLPNLLSLSLNGNENLKTLELNNTTRLKRLELLNAKKLTKFDVGNNLPNLTILSIDGSVKVTGEFHNLNVLTMKNDENLQRLKDDDFKINRCLTSLSYTHGQFNHTNYDFLQDKFPILTSIDLSDNLIEGTFSSLTNFLSNFPQLKFIKLDGNPLLKHLSNDEDKLEFKVLLKKIIEKSV